MRSCIYHPWTMIKALTFDLDIWFHCIGKSTCNVSETQYRANTAVLEAYLEILPDGKSWSGFFVGDPNESDNSLFAKCSLMHFTSWNAPNCPLWRHLVAQKNCQSLTLLEPAVGWRREKSSWQCIISIFGSIRNTGRRLEVTQNASEINIATVLIDNIFFIVIIKFIWVCSSVG